MKYYLLIGLWSVLVLGETQESLIYSPIGKRDPFRLPVTEGGVRSPSSTQDLDRYGVEQLQLKGILREGNNAKALFEDPEGKTHIIAEGDIIGREKATVSRVLKTEVILTQRTYNYLGVENLYEKVISLPQK